MISNSSERNYGIDLLKIVSMFMVVVLHILGHGGVLDHALDLTLNDTVAWYIEVLFRCAVNLFALTTGYLCVNKKFKFKNIINLWLCVLFYNVIINLFFKGTKLLPLITSFFPVSNNAYWYFSSYFCFILFIPFVNKFLNSIDKLEYNKLVITILFVMCGIGFCSRILHADVVKISSGYSPIWLLSLYIVGGYVKLFKFKFKNHSKTFYFLLYLLSSLIALLSRIVILKLSFLKNYFVYDVLIRYNSLPIFFNALILLLLFIKIDIKASYKNVISFFSGLSFSVYLIHDNASIRNMFIKDNFSFVVGMPVYQMVFMILFTAVVIYVVCTIIDIFRYYLFKFLRVEKLSDWLDKKIVLMLTKKG